MYSTCIFCAGSLGRNDVLEHFQVGRRIAFDPAKGRLWVVCPKCERWNLTPLESRWEAIEDAERIFRSTRIRISSDNIGLARLNEGLELVRIGEPPRIEFAAWRYGDQFGRRRRRTILVAGGGAIAGIALPAGYVVGGLAGATAPYLALGAGLTALAYNFASFVQAYRYLHKVRAVVHDGRNVAQKMSQNDLRSASIVPVGGDDGWRVQFSRRIKPRPGAEVAERRDRGATKVPNREEINLSGDAALCALAIALPHVNMEGASARNVRSAVQQIETASGFNALMRSAAEWHNPNHARSYVAHLPAATRVALEMVLHERDERDAENGQLAQLEQRWRDAEEIAAIADSLLLPDDVVSKFNKLRLRLGK